MVFPGIGCLQQLSNVYTVNSNLSVYIFQPLVPNMLKSHFKRLALSAQSHAIVTTNNKRTQKQRILFPDDDACKHNSCAFDELHLELAPALSSYRTNNRLMKVVKMFKNVVVFSLIYMGQKNLFNN